MAETRSEDSLAESILASLGPENVVQTTLMTDERVIARVTDGIYRQPGSALRELISNAYDADATKVVINTDAPRFDRISIEDDGHGMSAAALAHLLRNIGGSAKRSHIGADLGVTAKNDPMRSPKGRRLIGKIGIGLFSVSQLTHTFQIISKEAGSDYRTIATVALRQYADEDFPGVTQENSRTFEAGKVNVWREIATDLESHGTTIVLTSIRPQARDTLRSRDIWNAIEQDERQFASDENASIDPPRYHIGRVDAGGGDLLVKTAGEFAALPWSSEDLPDVAFRKLVQCVWDEIGQSTPNPQLDRIFDYYLRMVWQLSLAVPLPYVEEHLFDLDTDGWAKTFELSNQPKGAAKALDGPVSSIRKRLDLRDPVGRNTTFDVFLDDLQLARPLKFRGLPTTNNALKLPLVFVGKCRENFSKIPRELSGGSLAFEAYLFWTPKVAPVEHQGSLIRIHGSSGTLFDATFMRYQVSEQTRLRQITCEIFVSEGLDSALNIDRESFNHAHPHSVYITKWLHSALRQVASAQKRLASEVRTVARDEGRGAAVSEIQRVANETWKSETDDRAARPPTIRLSADDTKHSAATDSYSYSRVAVLPPDTKIHTAKSKARDEILEEKLKAIAQVLASFGLLDAVPKRKQEKLLRAIFEILNAPEEL